MSSKHSWLKTITSLFITCLFAVLTACGSPAADAAGKAKSSKAKAAEPAKAPDAKPAEKAESKPAPAEKKDEQLVANFNFHEWDKQTPRRWIAEPADKVVKTAGSTPNSVYVELKPSGSDKPTTLRQRLSGNLAGKSLTVTLRAKASEDKMLSAKFSFETQSGPQTVVLDADGNSAWRSVTKTVSVPADAKAGSGMLAVVLRAAAKQPVLVDYLTIKSK